MTCYSICVCSQLWCRIIWILQESRWNEGMDEGIHCFITALAYSHINIAFVNEVNVKDYFEVLVTKELFMQCWLCYTGLNYWMLQAVDSRPHHGPVVDSVPSENEYQEHFLGVKAAGAWGWQPHHIHVPNVMEIWEPKLPGPLWTTPGLLRNFFNFFYKL
jgi:hypothetical protein